jgi:hypothetical protein
MEKRGRFFIWNSHIDYLPPFTLHWTFFNNIVRNFNNIVRNFNNIVRNFNNLHNILIISMYGNDNENSVS